MPQFSAVSAAHLGSCDSRLQTLFYEVVRFFDCKVLEGHRDREAQELAFSTGRSQLHWPDGRHNALPSRAVDVAPYPIDWGDRERAVYFAGFVMGTAKRLGIDLRWGGDWNRDTQVRDNKFDDLVHFELVD